MAGEALMSTGVGWHGLEGDRRWAFVRDDATANGFPWLTLRENAEMAHFKPFFVDPSRPDKSKTNVIAPSGAVFDVTEPALASILHPSGARIIKQDRGAFDTFPLSLISRQSITKLAERVELPFAAERFRPNILIDLMDNQPFGEDALVGCVLRIGSARMRVDKRDGRCVVITIDPVTTWRDPSMLRDVAQFREGCLGVCGTTVEPGRLAVGDTVCLETVE